MLYIDRDNKTPIYQQIYEQLKRDILTGNIPVNARITSTRSLAKELQVGRNSVENAYDQLRLEGYITSKPGAGYIVNKLEFDLMEKPSEAYRQEEPQFKPLSSFHHKVKYSFQYGELDESSFPKKLWRTYGAHVLDGPLTQSWNGCSDGKGDYGLRQQIKEYLYVSRGVKCETEQVILCSGTQSALEIVVRIFSGEKTIAMEEPCYEGARAVFQSNGFQIQPILVGEDGIEIQCLSSKSVPMVYLTPSHQFPIGAVMPIHNRLEILNHARKSDMIIIEDDYDSEFRYKGRPIPSLQSIDQAGRVIYIGTFSKSLSPGLRMSYLILPSWLSASYDEKYHGYECTIPLMEQKILYHFMKDGHWEKHLRRVCLSQKRKHDALIAAIGNVMGDRVNIYGHHAGLHLLLEFKNGEQEDILVKEALKYGVFVSPVSPSWLEKSNYKTHCVILGYGGIKEEDILPAVERLNKAWFENG